MGKDKFDVVDFIIEFEQGGLSDDAIIDGFQYLIDTGLVWQLQGSYGRMAKMLIEDGFCREK